MYPRMFWDLKCICICLCLPNARVTSRSYVLFVFNQHLWYSNFWFWSLNNCAFPVCLGTSHVFCPGNIRMWAKCLFRTSVCCCWMTLGVGGSSTHDRFLFNFNFSSEMQGMSWRAVTCGRDSTTLVL